MCPDRLVKPFHGSLIVDQYYLALICPLKASAIPCLGKYLYRIVYHRFIIKNPWFLQPGVYITFSFLNSTFSN